MSSQMRCERFDVDYGGPALVQATATGNLIHPQQGNRLASFTPARIGSGLAGRSWNSKSH